jgi:glycosyltransferase involved in cell wall biosynthesis
MNFSVLMSVYINDKPIDFEIALRSIINQSLVPSEIVIVQDGPIDSKINNIIDAYTDYNIKIVKITNNVGLGNALNIGLLHCNNEFVARMDSDDISVYNRFEIQLNYLVTNPHLAVIGGKMIEFIDTGTIENIIRNIPHDNDEIISFSNFRNPLNHPTVMFRKSIITKVGSYENILYFEDYFLWLKLIKNGYQIRNINTILLNYRLNINFVERRSGFKYLKSEYFFYKMVYNRNLLPLHIVILNLIIKLPFRILPKYIINLFYIKKLRSKKNV